MRTQTRAPIQPLDLRIYSLVADSLRPYCSANGDDDDDDDDDDGGGGGDEHVLPDSHHATATNSKDRRCWHTLYIAFIIPALPPLYIRERRSRSAPPGGAKTGLMIYIACLHICSVYH